MAHQGSSTAQLLHLGCAALLGVGCGGTPPPSRSPAPRLAQALPSPPAPAPLTGALAPDPDAWTSCVREFVPSGEARQDLARLTRACGAVGELRALTPVAVRQQGQHDPPDRFVLEVPRGGGCYRVFAAGDRTIRDLDLAVRDREQGLAGDLGPDRYPILPPRGPLCLDAAGRYLLEVSVHAGAGEYALQIWGRPIPRSDPPG